jgi:integrase
LRWCEDVELVEEDLADKVIIPTIPADDQARDVAVAHERAQEIINYFCRYEWATREHLIIHTLYHTGMRRSGLRALDVDDWHPDDRYLAVRNRDDEGSRLKLGDNGERNVTIHDERLVDAINDWIDVRRPDVVDEYGREPLIASSQGRMYGQSITGVCYRVTRPCVVTGECPHDRDLGDCEATGYSEASKCPSSVSAHPIRRSAITHHLSQDVPKDICSGRMSVSPSVLDQHYDARTAEEKRRNRQEYLDQL